MPHSCPSVAREASARARLTHRTQPPRSRARLRSKYFVVHALRQTDKTTALFSFVCELTAEARFVT